MGHRPLPSAFPQPHPIPTLTSQGCHLQSKAGSRSTAVAPGCWEPTHSLASAVTSTGSQPQLDPCGWWLRLQNHSGPGLLTEGHAVGPLCGGAPRRAGGLGLGSRKPAGLCSALWSGGQGPGPLEGEGDAMGQARLAVIVNDNGQHALGPHSALSVFTGFTYLILKILAVGNTILSSLQVRKLRHGLRTLPTVTQGGNSRARI